jgi:triosephosphate isomerase
LHIPEVATLLDGSALGLGAQNVADREEGAFTGEVSAAMLKEFGCRFAIVGHSERRHLYQESDALIAARFAAAKRGGLCPILCVGETLGDRESGQTEAVVHRQLRAVLDLLGARAFAGTVIAYEPVWAIGTGRTASPDQAQEVHAFIRDQLAAADAEVAQATRVLYGGSVKPDNADALFAMADIDGGLIGGAALKAEDFLAICRAASHG